MKCRDCDYVRRGWFRFLPDAYVCIGQKEPFVIDNFPDAECIEYKGKKNNQVMDDGIYMELFAIKNGVRYNVKIVNMRDMTNTLTNSLMDGIEKLCE